MIARGERRPRALVKAVNARIVTTENLEDLDGAPLFFVNVNTPEDYERARAAVAIDSKA